MATPVPPTPSGGTPRPAPPPARAQQTTQQDLQATSQEIEAQTGIVPSEAEVAQRVIIKRQGRLALDLRKVTTWQTVALVAVVLGGPRFMTWADAHAEMAWGLVGLAGIVVGSVVGALRILRVRNDDAPPSGGPA